MTDQVTTNEAPDDFMPPLEDSMTAATPEPAFNQYQPPADFDLMTGARRKPGVSPLSAQPGRGLPEEQEDRPFDFGNVWDLSSKMDTTERFLSGRESQAFEPDPTYRLQEHLPELKERVPEHLWPQLHNRLPDIAVSREHAEFLTDKLLEQAATAEELSKYAAVPTFLTQMATGMTDPINLLIGIATGPLGVGRTVLSAAVRSALVAGATEGLLEYGLAQDEVYYDPNDAWRNMLAGGVLGAGFGAAFSRAAPGTVAHADGQAQVPMYTRLTNEYDANVNAIYGTDTAGAARVGDTGRVGFNPTETMDELLASYPETAMPGIRFDVVARAGGDNATNLERAMVDILFPDPVGKKGHEVATAYAGGTSALERVDLRTDVYDARLLAPAKSDFTAWADRQGVSNLRAAFSEEMEIRFWTDVKRAVETDEVPEHLAATVEAYRKNMRDMLDDAKAQGLPGFENIQYDKTYVPRKVNDQRLREANSVNTFKVEESSDPRIKGAAEELFYRGLRLAQPGIEHNLAVRMAIGIVRNQLDRSMGRMGRLDLRGDLLSQIKERIGDMGLKQEDLDSLDKLLLSDKKVGQGGELSYAKRRLDIDTNASVRVRDAETGTMRDLQLHELFDSNLMDLHARYARRVGGMSAVAERTKALPEELQIRSDADFERIYDMIKQEAKDEGTEAAKKRAEKAIEQLEVGRKRLLGLSINDQNSNLTHAARNMRDWAFISKLGSVIWPQGSEISNVLAGSTFSTLVQKMPVLKHIRSGIFKGKLADTELAQLVEAWFGEGTSWLRNDMSFRYGEYDEGLTGKATVTKLMHHLKKPVAAPISIATDVQRKSSVITQLQNWVGFADKGKIPKAHSNRMKGNGLDDAMQQRIMKQMKSHAISKKGVLGKDLQDPNFNAWTDVEARDALILATRREARRQIQDADAGSQSPWANNLAFQMVTQFKAFAMSAYSKQLVHGMHHRDLQTFLKFSMNTLFFGLMYLGRTHFNSIGREDREEYLRKKLGTWDDPNWEKIVRTSVAGSGWMSILPMVGGPLSDALGFNIFGDDYRSSGLSSGLSSKNIPTGDLVHRSGELLFDLADSALRGDEFSQSEWRNLRQILPYQNLPVIGQMLNYLEAKAYK